MEKKKELLIKVLTKLKPYRNLADGILALISNSDVDEKIIDAIVLIINQSVKKTKNSKEKTRLTKTAEIIKKIQQKEMREKDVEEAEALLSQI
jgi:hypothetical protein